MAPSEMVARNIPASDFIEDNRFEGGILEIFTRSGIFRYKILEIEVRCGGDSISVKSDYPILRQYGAGWGLSSGLNDDTLIDIVLYPIPRGHLHFGSAPRIPDRIKLGDGRIVVMSLANGKDDDIIYVFWPKVALVMPEFEN